MTQRVQKHSKSHLNGQTLNPRKRFNLSHSSCNETRSSMDKLEEHMDLSKWHYTSTFIIQINCLSKPTQNCPMLNVWREDYINTSNHTPKGQTSERYLNSLNPLQFQCNETRPNIDRLGHIDLSKEHYTSIFYHTKPFGKTYTKNLPRCWIRDAKTTETLQIAPKRTNTRNDWPVRPLGLLFSLGRIAAQRSAHARTAPRV
jgi:hypothetical protein